MRERVRAYLESDGFQTDLQLIGLTLIIKLGVLLLGVLAVNLLAHRTLTSPIQILEIWNQWDAPHYQDLAVLGRIELDLVDHVVGVGLPQDRSLGLHSFPLVLVVRSATADAPPQRGSP